MTFSSSWQQALAVSLLTDEALAPRTSGVLPAPMAPAPRLWVEPVWFPGSAVLQDHCCIGRQETKSPRVSPRGPVTKRDLLTWAHTFPWGRLLSQTSGMEQQRGKSGPLGLHLRVWPFLSQPSHRSAQERRPPESATPCISTQAGGRECWVCASFLPGRQRKKVQQC